MRTRRLLFVGAFAIMLGYQAGAQGHKDESARAIEQLISHQKPSFINGFGKTISGETIIYHSANEYVHDALLVRTTDGDSRIEWETATPPDSGKDSVQLFAWMAGLAGSKGVHRFEMFVDGQPRFSFSSAPDSSKKIWIFGGKEGESLTFVVTEVDQFQDLFGYMFLKMPMRLLKAGQPLTIRVVGAAEGSSAWYMTFQHSLESGIRVEPLPLLVAKEESVFQLIKVGVEHYGPDATAVAHVDQRVGIEKRLTWGVTTFMLRIDTVSRPESRQVVVEADGKILRKENVVVKPVHRRIFYLLPHSHTDIGYSAYQAEVEKYHIRYVDEAIKLAEETSSYPAGSQFKWNIEVLWPLESYLAQASDSQKRRLMDAIKKGWIGLNGLYANLLTGLCRPEELVHATDFARQLESKYEIRIKSAMITDIPAYTSSLITGLSMSGIRYFSSGPNYMPTTPDGGDRVGYVLKTWGDKPFYWRSQSREHEILFWMAGRGYSWFHGLNMGGLRSASLTTICEYLDELDRKDYPYDMVQVRYTVGGDNGPPDPDLSICVRDWNARYLSPKMVVATTDQMFEEFERRYGKYLPTYEGDLTPYWEDGAASTARETAINRNVAEQLVQAQALTAMIDPGKFDAQRFYSAWRNVVLFSEHTWGAASSVSEPDSPDVKAQWEYKKAFVENARTEADHLTAQIIDGRRVPLLNSSIDVINTNSWTRTDIVLIPRDLAGSNNAVTDRRGNVIQSQRLSTGELAFVAKNVPPLGCQRFNLTHKNNVRKLSELIIERNRVSNGVISLNIDEKSGSINSLIWNKMELVDTLRGAGLNQYFYVPGRNPQFAVTDSRVRITVKEKGPIVASLLVESSPQGCNSLNREYRLVKSMERLDIFDVLDKKSVREKESVHFGFPFLVPGGTVRTDGGWEVVIPEVNQLQGSCKDFYSVQRWVDISNDSFGVTWANVDAPLVEIGVMTNESPSETGHRVWKKVQQSAQNIYSYAMNNYWHTNYKADQAGLVTLRYSIGPHDAFNLARAEQFGIERSQPLIVAPNSSTKRLESSLFTVAPASVIITSLKPCEDGKGFVVRIYNAGETSANARVNPKRGTQAKIYSSSSKEERKEEIHFPIVLPKFGIATLRIETIQ
jgi:alpha-mannosidase